MNINTRIQRKTRASHWRITLLSALCIVIPGSALAHQPRIVQETETVVIDPEISKAYYGELEGQPHLFRFNATKPFELYVNILVPDIKDQSKDVSAVVFKNQKEFAVLDGTTVEWKRFFEPFGHDTYWMGPELKTRGEAGEYEIRVSSSNNLGKYALAIGETEMFDAKEILHTLNTIPKLKKEFFLTSPVDFILSPFGWGLIVSMFILSWIFGLLYRALLRTYASAAPRRKQKNIGSVDRWIRLLLSVALFVVAIMTTWNPFMFFFSGFTLFEAVIGWCGLYAALGKNTCPIR